MIFYFIHVIGRHIWNSLQLMLRLQMPICPRYALGAATFQDGQLSSEWYSLIDPNHYFDQVNVSIHGIDESMIVGAPTYVDIASTIGEVIVFTGALEIPRRAAADLAAVAGCEVAQSVTTKTTLLVVGDMDVKRLAGHDKSSKHRKAEELINAGFPIRIIRETDYRELVAIS